MKCKWFKKCPREATHTVRHPVLGNVPTCSICIDLLGLNDHARPLPEDSK